MSGTRQIAIDRSWETTWLITGIFLTEGKTMNSATKLPPRTDCARKPILPEKAQCVRPLHILIRTCTGCNAPGSTFNWRCKSSCSLLSLLRNVCRRVVTASATHTNTVCTKVSFPSQTIVDENNGKTGRYDAIFGNPVSTTEMQRWEGIGGDTEK